MSLKLKLNARPSFDGKDSNAISPSEAAPPTPSTATSAGPPKLKLSVSQPPTPINENAPGLTITATKKRAPSKSSLKSQSASKKRGANDDISPAAKRPTKASGLPSRRLSLKPPPTPRVASDSVLTTNSINRIKLGLAQRKPSLPKIRSINVKRPPPPREPGVGYDSEDSGAEEDPAIQQTFVLRMQPGEDCDFLREAIANGKIGALPTDGGVQVSLRFLDAQCRRAVVTIRGRKYAAALVDLPCIVETMKSWDKKGWWKVSDVCQMLLVLGRCANDEEARKVELPRDVDKNTMQYAHGLTPPMHWVRKRRFRKRPNYRDMANVEEEVERLLKEDNEVILRGGDVTSEVMGRAEAERERSESHFDDDADAEGEAIETVETDAGYADDYGQEDDEGAADLEDDLQAMFDRQDDDEIIPSTAAILQSPGALADKGATATAIDHVLNAESAIESPIGTPDAGTEQNSDEDASQVEDEEDDEDDDDDDDDEEDEDSPDVMDEDALARAAERNQQLEEVADLEREVEKQRAKAAGMKNQLLKEKALAQLLTLEEELRTKRAVFGLDVDD